MSFGGFGQAAAKPAFSFGNNSQSSTTPAQPAPSGGTGLFGSTTNQQQGATGGGLFGQQPKPAGGLFGSAASTSTQPQQQPGQSGGLFGGLGQSQQGQQPQQGQTGGGGLFGSTTSNTASGGLFGQKPAGSGLFGSTSSAPAPAPAPAAGGGLFGSTSQPQQQNAGGGLFGSTQQALQQQASGGLFGAQQPQQQQQQGGGLFGSTAQKPGGVFGGFGASTSQPQQQQQQQQPQQQQSGLFGSTLGAPQQQQMGQSQMQQSQLGQSMFGVKKEQDIESRIRTVQNAWDSASPECRFKYFFYNVVEEGTASRYGRPANATDDAQWAKALRDNPDPNSMVPVLAVGWSDVKKRQQMQENLAAVHQERTSEITAALSHTRQTSLSSSIRLANLQQRQSQLVHRLIHLASVTPGIVPLNQQGGVLRDDEVALARKLEGVKRELEGAAGSVRGGSVRRGDGELRGRLLGQVNELWGQLEEVRRRRKVRGQEGRETWIGDERLLAEIAEVLTTQQTAIQKLSDLAQEENFDADVVLHGHGR
ncbi:hypothetical protein L202_03592 [Cryptococcus amylolentus CBS 6039]|uniref:Nucleoporin Nup54 alpha-helical domain-containing protein n=1 Tax=Cryptococcus amylolentus CBS 6039 TaxID=1295533 RepID=A0A1E3HTL6_9TREE|nr:hypothetical protein L202_03592 [Cryptococcus amylolentus CBS 6039]ODN79652.1 hypothetical protein L202_03592 [Cryptococcus amylolentus CBS 6039]